MGLCGYHVVVTEIFEGHMVAVFNTVMCPETAAAVMRCTATEL